VSRALVHEALHEPLEIRLEARSDAVVVVVCGACDLSCHEQLRERLLEAEALDRPEVVVDLTGASFIDSNGLRVLIGAWNRARQSGHRFQVALRDSGQVRGVLEVTGVDQVLPVATPEHA
jgi:anti-sigma B factor antagonist